MRMCEWISLVSWKLQTRHKNETQKYWNNLKFQAEWNDKPSLHPSHSDKKVRGWLTKEPFWKRSSFVAVAIISLSCKWALVSRFLYFDMGYTMPINVASHIYVDPNWTRAFVASFFKDAYFFAAFNQNLAKLESSNSIFWFSSGLQLCHLQCNVTTSLSINSKWKLNISICHFFQFREAFFKTCLQIHQVVNNILLYIWKWHLTIRCCWKFLVMWKQTEIIVFFSRGENSQLVNKNTNGSLQFKHPIASTLQWNIQLFQFLENISQERKTSNEQIIWKKVAFSSFWLCRKSFTSFLRIQNLFSVLPHESHLTAV